MSIPEEFAPVTLDTARLVLRAAGPEDAQFLFDGYSGCRAATRFMTFETVPDVQAQRAHLVRVAQKWRERAHDYTWAITAKEDGRVVGTVRCALNPPKADIGYALCTVDRGKGYAFEATQAVVEWACQHPQIFRVWATCHPENEGSVRLLRRLGFTMEGQLENWAPRPQLGMAASASLMFARIPPRSPEEPVGSSTP